MRREVLQSVAGEGRSVVFVPFGRALRIGAREAPFLWVEGGGTLALAEREEKDEKKEAETEEDQSPDDEADDEGE